MFSSREPNDRNKIVDAMFARYGARGEACVGSPTLRLITPRHCSGQSRKRRRSRIGSVSNAETPIRD